MSQQLISLNPCLQKLQQEGYSLEVCGGFLVIHHIPYLNANREILEGKLIMSLNLSGNKVLKPQDHTAYWSGGIPYEMNGCKVSALINNSIHRTHGNGLESDHFLSCKPDKEIYSDQKYPSYYEKVLTYCQRISTPADLVNKDICNRIRNQVVQCSSESVFQYADTNSTRSDIFSLSKVFESQKVAIVGVGGTGSYLLDYLAKMPIKEIHLYDDDLFNTHNAFRCPGAASIESLNECMPKVEYLKGIYSNMHKGIYAHNERLTSSNITQLDEMNAVFICVDKACVRNLIASHLIEHEILFVDSGLGIRKEVNSLSGQIRITTGYSQNYDHVSSSFGTDMEIDDEYSSKNQTALLNTLASVIMLIKWKRMMNYYSNTVIDNNIVYSISTNELLKG